MKRVLLLVLAILCPGLLWAPVEEPLNIEETDGAPSTWPYKLKVSPGSLTDNGDGTATLTTGAGGGGGGSSSLEVFVGSARSSPTASITANTSQFTGSVSGSTFTFTLNSASVTLQGNSNTFLAVGLTTASLQTQITATALSTQTLATAVGSSTGSLQTQITATALSTQTLATAVGSSTGSLQTQITATALSTQTLVNQYFPVKIGSGTIGPFNVSATSASVTGPEGFYGIYGISGGSVTARNIASGECVQAGSGGLLAGTGLPCGSGGGGGSPIAMGTGTSSGWPTSVLQSSPTLVSLDDSAVFNGRLLGGATYFRTINFSSITAIGIPTVSGNLTLSVGAFGVPITDISTGSNLTATGQANMNADAVNVGPTSLSTGTIGTLDISAQTNLAASGQANLNGDTVNVGPTSLSTGTIGTADISAQTNLATSGQANMNGDTVNVGPTSFSTGTIGTVDMSAQTNLTATGNANMNADAVNVGPVKIGSGTLGAFDVTTTSASATGSAGLTVLNALNIPNGTGPTVDATGEVALDTSDNALVAWDGQFAQVIAHSTHSFTVTISSEGWNGHSFPVWRAPHDMDVTINKIMAESLTANTTVMFQLDETTFGGTGSAGTDVFSVIYSSAHNQGVTTTSFANAVISAQSSLVFNTSAAGAAGGSPKGVSFTVYYTKNRD